MQQRNGYLDQWRGISVLMVVLDHLLLFRVPLSSPGLDDSTLVGRLSRHAAAGIQSWATSAGVVGVCVFFVLSGYLITSLMVREEQRTGRVSLPHFVIRRTFRIFPALLVFLVGMWSLHAVGAIHMSAQQAFGADLLMCNTALVDCGHMGHFWTLAVEEQFYLFWPLVFVLSGRMRLVIVAFTLLISLIASTLPNLRVNGWLNNGLALACISSGTLFAMSPRFRAVFRWTVAVPRWVWGLAVVIGMPLAQSRWPHFEWVLIPLVPLLVVTVVLVRTHEVEGPVAEALRRIGVISYSLYLWHAVVSWPPDTYLTTWFSRASVLALPMAWVSYRFVERPMIEVGRRLARGRSPQRVSAA